MGAWRMDRVNCSVANKDHFDADLNPTSEKKPDADLDPIMLNIKFCNKIFLLKNSLQDLFINLKVRIDVFKFIHNIFLHLKG
jgi:hypothetical protein